MGLSGYFTSKLELSDGNNSTLVVQMDLERVRPSGGRWLPAVPGKVRSSPDINQNPFTLEPSDANGNYANAICYTIDGSGARIKVMQFNGFAANMYWQVMSGGSGYLHPDGNLTMKEGIFTWRNVTRTTSNSTSDDDDSAVPVASEADTDSDGSSSGD
jgi:hypothetical protein